MLVSCMKAENTTKKNTSLYISTDETDKSFFKPFIQDYDTSFLDDFKPLFPDLNPKFYGMLDQIVASRGGVFFGTAYSTFTSYINRLRGYYSKGQKSKGYENGEIESYYLHEKSQDIKLMMKHFEPVNKPFWAREFPVAWRDIDKGSQ